MFDDRTEEIASPTGPRRIRYAVGVGHATPPLLLLHGVLRGWEDWSCVLGSVAPRWRVLAPDARGHGGSFRAPGHYRVNDYVGDAVAFLDAHAREPALLFGHSLGAMVAAAVTAERPEAVRGVILEDPPYQTMGRGIRATPYHAMFSGMQRIAVEGGTVDELAARVADIRLPAPDGTTRRLGDTRDGASIRFSARCLSRLDPEVLTPLVEGTWLDGHDPREIFPRVRCPALLLQADPTAGGAMTDGDAALAEELMPRCVRVRFRGTPHQIHASDTAGTLRAFHGFAESLR